RWDRARSVTRSRDFCCWHFTDGQKGQSQSGLPPSSDVDMKGKTVTGTVLCPRFRALTPAVLLRGTAPDLPITPAYHRVRQNTRHKGDRSQLPCISGLAPVPRYLAPHHRDLAKRAGDLSSVRSTAALDGKGPQTTPDMPAYADYRKGLPHPSGLRP